MATQLLWFEGKPLPVTRPQNQNGIAGHFLYRGSAPIFATTKEQWLAPVLAIAAQARAQGIPCEETMLLRRLRVYTLTVPTPVPQGVLIPECGRCFAQMACAHSGLRLHTRPCMSSAPVPAPGPPGFVFL